MTVAVSAPYPQRDLPEGSWFGDRDRKFCSGQCCWSTVLHEKLIAVHLVKKFAFLSGTLQFMTEFTATGRPLYLPLNLLGPPSHRRILFLL